MAVPFRRTSKRTKRLRRTHFKLNVTGLVTCPNCGNMIKSHRVCPHCGYYDDKQVLVNGKYQTVAEVKKQEASGKKSTRKKTTKKVEETSENK